MLFPPLPQTPCKKNPLHSARFRSGNVVLKRDKCCPLISSCKVKPCGTRLSDPEKTGRKTLMHSPTDCSESHALPALSCITEENAHRPESGTCAPHVCTVRSADAWQTAHWRHFCKTRKPDLSPASRPQRNRKPKARPLVVSYSAAAAVQDLLYHSCNRFARLLPTVPRNFYNFM